MTEIDIYRLDLTKDELLIVSACVQMAYGSLSRDVYALHTAAACIAAKDSGFNWEELYRKLQLLGDAYIRTKTGDLKNAFGTDSGELGSGN